MSCVYFLFCEAGGKVIKALSLSWLFTGLVFVDSMTLSCLSTYLECR